MAELKDSCVKPARGPIMPAIESSVTSEKDTLTKEAIRLFDTPQLIIYNSDIEYIEKEMLGN